LKLVKETSETCGLELREDRLVKEDREGNVRIETND